MSPDPAKPLRIAWFGPIPSDGGAVPGVARDILAGLLELGHELDCYLAGEPQPLPQALSAAAALTVHWSGSRWRWQRWYSKDPLAAFVSGTLSRARGMRRLGQDLVRNNQAHPYDVIYQFSNIEIFGLRRHLDQLPPLVLHPETHLAGELRWMRRESHLDARCTPRYRRSLVKAAVTLRSLVQRRDIHKAAVVICISRAFRDLLIKDYRIAPGDTVVVPNSIRLERFTADLQEDRRDPLTIVFIGRIAVRKGVDTLVELTHRLKDLQGSVRIEIIGDHSMWSDYRPLLEDLNTGLANYRGFVSPAEVAAQLAVADLLIQPSKYEPFGLTVGEALAAGVAVVATEEVGAAEDVDPQCCLVTPVADVAAFEQAVRTMIQRLRGPEGPAIRHRARSEAERLFAPAQVSQRVADVLSAACRPGLSAPEVVPPSEPSPRPGAGVNGRVSVMNAQARVKGVLKPLLFSSRTVPRSIRFGPAKGVSLYLSRLTGIQRELGLYETELNAEFNAAVQGAQVIYDVGASSGYTTLLLGNLAGHATVVSFEPDRDAVRALERNLQLNPSIRPRVRIMATALGSRSAAPDQGALAPQALDDLVQQEQIPPPQLIKIDVDGEELEVLSGASQTIQQFRPVVIVETHSWALEEGCLAFLRSLGYAVRIIKNARWRILWPELRPIEHNRWLVATPVSSLVKAAGPG